MMSQDEANDREEYVRVAARRLGMSLADEQVSRVAAAFARNAEQAALVMGLALPEDVESAAIFRL